MGWGGNAFTERRAIESFPMMLCEELGKVGAVGHDLIGVYVGMGDVVVLLDFVEVCGVAEPGV